MERLYAPPNPPPDPPPPPHTVVNPLDAVKVRLQVQPATMVYVPTQPGRLCPGRLCSGPVGKRAPPSPSFSDFVLVSLHRPKMYTSLTQAWRRIYFEEGLRGLLLPGLAASMLREGTYSSIRVGRTVSGAAMPPSLADCSPAWRVCPTPLSGLYPAIKAFYQGDRQGDAGLGRKILAGLTTGGLGSALANPTDLVKIRLQGEAGRVVNGVYVVRAAAAQSRPTVPSKLTRAHFPSKLNVRTPACDISLGSMLGTHRRTRARCTHCWRLGGMRASVASTRVRMRHHGKPPRPHQKLTEQPPSRIIAGVGATSIRAALLTSGQLASYDHSKHLFKTHGIMQEGVPLHIVYGCTRCAAGQPRVDAERLTQRHVSRTGRCSRSSLIAGVCASTACAPADMVKSRIMHDRERKHAGGQRLYKNSIDCAIKVRHVSVAG